MTSIARFLIAASGLISLAACGGGDAGVTAAASAPTAVATATSTTAVTPTPPAPTPPTPTTPTPPAPSTASVELPKIASNFDVAAELRPAQDTGAIPPSSAPDTVGAFRFLCTPSHEAFDDPIVYPGQPGRAHLHQFFGNTGANASSTYASLRTTGDSTCGNRLNRSAYWIPAMMNGKGRVVRPDYVAIYYKRPPETSIDCQRQAQACVPLPRGLRFVFGYDMLNMSAGATGAAYFNCDGPTATPGHYGTIAEAAKNCPAGNRLGAVIHAPSCWDGRNLDSPDHRSHVAYPQYVGQAYAQCPTTHPMMIAAFTLGAWYSVDDDLDHSGTWGDRLDSWHFSSDAAMGKASGSTFHADWWGAWDDDVMAMWTDACINRLLNCSGGDLGNGKQLRNAPGFSWTAIPHTVPIPPR
jgi:Domain of unknown function (DUF1996)